MDGEHDTRNQDVIRRTGRGMAWLAALALIGLLWLFFADIEARRNSPNRNVSVIPGASAELVLKRNAAGHYVVPGTINGQPVTFMLDTGATTVAIPARLGKQLGLPAGPTFEVSTANGIAQARLTSIAELALGPFVMRQVQAGLNPGMDHDDTILLGMNVLKRLEFTQRGDTLILRTLPQQEN
ncbi:MAG: retroviral-like aspartic protease family protein [Azoarcus sp.]|jgi:aspartyl protease family protein|nr:retroviral-like aspartic protease family protein [Azoarcus sp.]